MLKKVLTCCIYAFLMLSGRNLFGSVKILTQNMKCESTGPSQNIAKVQDLARLAQQYDLDILLLQEFCTYKFDRRFEQLKFLRAQFPFMYSQFTHVAYDSFDEHLIILSRHEPVGYRKFSLPSSPLQRGMLAIYFDNFVMANTHLSHMDDPTFRSNQIHFIARAMELHENVIIGGDFNSGPFAPETSGFWDYFYRPYFPYDTYVGKDAEELKSRKLDGFWYKTKTLSIFQQYIWRIPSIGSDHLGVILTID